MKIGIVGLGVVGGSLAMSLQENGEYQIYGIDHSNETLEKALAMGLIEGGATDARDILPEMDMTVLALYPTDAPLFVEQNADFFKKNSLLVDFSGIKGYTIKHILQHMPEGVEAVFAHPMAGREKSGLAYASREVNLAANFLITPTDENTAEALIIVEKMALDAGFGKVTYLSPELHDASIAYTSQLPHALAVALVNSDQNPEETVHLIGDSYRDLTRIAAINGKLWAELFLGNRRKLLKTIGDFSEQLTRIERALEENDGETLEEIFSESTRRHAEMQKRKK